MEYAIGLTVVIIKVAVGLGFVIFVHELGHFAVAKLCGVKCEKFYLGFDIAGYKFCKFRWGETEYGVGILPLGGYVKMLGQEDNPAKIRAEMERARLAEQGPAASADGAKPQAESNQTENPKSNNLQISNPPPPAPNPPLLDPRSFLAKSVPRRMAIIAAGVIMNLIFAFVLAVVAYAIGVRQIPCIVGDVFPGEPAWQADLRTGDVIEKINGREMREFRDLQAAISLGDIDAKKGVPFEIRRPGAAKSQTVIVTPDRARGAYTIGISNPRTTQLLRDVKTWLVLKRHAVLPGTAAAAAEPAFRLGDRVVQIDDVPIDDYASIERELARKADKKITVVVERDVLDSKNKPTGRTERVSIAVEPNPMRRLGLVMKMGKITAVQAGSPAQMAGIQPGDMLVKPGGDPLTLPDRLDKMAGETLEITLQRETEKTPIETTARLREPYASYPPADVNNPVAVPSLGIAYQVLNRVDSVIEGSPAAQAGLRPGDVIVNARILPPDKETLKKFDFDKPAKVDLVFDADNRNWPTLMSLLQQTLPGSSVELTFLRDDKPQTVTLRPVAAADWFNPDRGLLFEPKTFLRKANSFGEALALGGVETLDSVTIVYRTLKKVGQREVSVRLFAGPISIAKVAGQKADQGTAALLLFLTLLSANLAVINFLPIPVLDGGHFVFLCYEGITGKPANEHVQVVLSYIGLAFIIALMVWVFGLDFGVFARR